MWCYFLNWMGPINEDFINKHGTQWSAGRIDADCNNDDDPDYSPFGMEFGIGPMHSDDWSRLAEWLDTLETPALLSKNEILSRFENEQSIKIRWLDMQE